MLFPHRCAASWRSTASGGSRAGRPRRWVSAFRQLCCWAPALPLATVQLHSRDASRPWAPGLRNELLLGPDEAALAAAMAPAAWPEMFCSPMFCPAVPGGGPLQQRAGAAPRPHRAQPEAHELGWVALVVMYRCWCRTGRALPHVRGALWLRPACHVQPVDKRSACQSHDLWFCVNNQTSPVLYLPALCSHAQSAAGRLPGHPNDLLAVLH